VRIVAQLLHTPKRRPHHRLAHTGDEPFGGRKRHANGIVVIWLARYSRLDQLDAPSIHDRGHTTVCRYGDAHGPSAVIGNAEYGGQCA
jgi:hypothetical protein